MRLYHPRRAMEWSYETYTEWTVSFFELLKCDHSMIASPWYSRTLQPPNSGHNIISTRLIYNIYTIQNNTFSLSTPVELCLLQYTKQFIMQGDVVKKIRHNTIMTPYKLVKLLTMTRNGEFLILIPLNHILERSAFNSVDLYSNSSSSLFLPFFMIAVKECLSFLRSTICVLTISFRKNI